jgi:hypothetical protein
MSAAVAAVALVAIVGIGATNDRGVTVPASASALPSNQQHDGVEALRAGGRLLANRLATDAQARLITP